MSALARACDELNDSLRLVESTLGRLPGLVEAWVPLPGLEAYLAVERDAGGVWVLVVVRPCSIGRLTSAPREYRIAAAHALDDLLAEVRVVGRDFDLRSVMISAGDPK